MKCKHEIIDNYLEEDDFHNLQKWLLPPYIRGAIISQEIELPWIYGGDIVTSEFQPDHSPEDKLQQWQLSHVFQKANHFSDYYNKLEHFILKINPIAIWRIKANLSVQQPYITEGGMHIDTPVKLEHTNMITSIYYLNTNDGYTKLEDGTKIKSVANRLVSFNSNIRHSGSTCTDDKIRVVLNIDYFKDIKI